MYLARVFYWLDPCVDCDLPPKDGETVWLLLDGHDRLTMAHRRCFEARSRRLPVAVPTWRGVA